MQPAVIIDTSFWKKIGHPCSKSSCFEKKNKIFYCPRD